MEGRLTGREGGFSQLKFLDFEVVLVVASSGFIATALLSITIGDAGSFFDVQRWVAAGVLAVWSVSHVDQAWLGSVTRGSGRQVPASKVLVWIIVLWLASSITFDALRGLRHAALRNIETREVLACASRVNCNKLQAAVPDDLKDRNDEAKASDVEKAGADVHSLQLSLMSAGELAAGLSLPRPGIFLKEPAEILLN